MKNIPVVMFIIMFLSCNNYDYKIADLKQQKKRFSDLPMEVKMYFNNPDDYVKEIGNELNLINLSSTTDFSLESIETWTGPWISFEKLKDNKKKISYRIETSVPDPLILYKNQLYIPDRYNILNQLENLEHVEFICYTLK